MFLEDMKPNIHGVALKGPQGSEGGGRGFLLQGVRTVGITFIGATPLSKDTGNTSSRGTAFRSMNLETLA